MSKFFDEAIRIRNGEAPVSARQPELLSSAPVVPSVLAAPEHQVGPPAPELKKLEMPLSSVLQEQFKGSDALNAAQEAYRALRTRLLRLRETQGLRTIVLTSAVQGEGKTMTALNLAISCAQLHELSVLLIDADIRTRGLSRQLGSPSGPGLCETIEGKVELKDAILATDIPNLHVLSAGSSSMSPPELLADKRFQDAMYWCSEKFKLVLVDSPPILNLADVELITASCDGVLMVVRAQGTQREVLRKSAGQIDNKKLLGAVYNASERIHQQYRYSYGGT